ncbi:cytochrome c3 family protein [Selenihalanaerobacter shriftii]|uniref:Cytochrome c nitrite reductase, small subunit n=1 Tax=Selenihalanaerobacter shriftii TaxID=142842 RepID=A0A1T4JJF9_9FIRM|nr:NapC/NirT family cytochrome c [Selenihalanaerobacter shriftii]SJZ30310.1 cytochrome c nitrite reductase, small subunit [Selenihalanaerobacter shriftii]
MKFNLKNIMFDAGIILSAIILSLGIKGSTESPEFCNNCHIMDPAYESWSRSAHSEVKCLECHEEPGFSGYLKTKAQGAEQAVTYLISSPDQSDLNAHVANKNCIDCHRSEEKVPSIPEDHQKRIESDMECAMCHKSTAH